MIYYTVSCEVERITDKAVLIFYTEGDSPDDAQKQWIPLSCCEAPDTIEVGDEEVRVARWYVRMYLLPHD